MTWKLEKSAWLARFVCWARAAKPPVITSAVIARNLPRRIVFR
jgi:hypothetical protein